jgi:archaellum component FlaD/FlaE
MDTNLQEFYHQESEKCFTNDENYSNFSLRGHKYHAQKRQETAVASAQAEAQATAKRKAEADALLKDAEDKRALAEADLQAKQKKLDDATAKEEKAKEEQKKAEDDAKKKEEELAKSNATITDSAGNIIASAKTDYTKIAMIGGGSLVAIVLIVALLRK